MLSLKLPSSTWVGGLSSCTRTQRYCYVYFLRGNQDPAPRLHYCLLAAPPLSLHPLPSLISNCLNLSFGTQGRSWRLESVPYKQGAADMEKFPCPGAPKGPAWFPPWDDQGTAVRDPVTRVCAPAGPDQLQETCMPQPAAPRSSPTHQQENTSFETPWTWHSPTPEHGSTHQWASNSHRAPCDPTLPTSGWQPLHKAGLGNQ